MYRSIVVDPTEECAPGGITDGLGKVMVLDHVLDGKFFIDNHIARRDKRACLFAGKVFTLSTDFQVHFG